MIKDLTSLTLAIPVRRLRHGVIGGGVAGGGTILCRSLDQFLIFAVQIGVINRHILRKIIHTDALPHRINLDSDPKQHDLATSHGGGRSLAALWHGLNTLFLSLENGMCVEGEIEWTVIEERVSAIYTMTRRMAFWNVVAVQCNAGIFIITIKLNKIKSRMIKSLLIKLNYPDIFSRDLSMGR